MMGRPLLSQKDDILLLELPKSNTIREWWPTASLRRVNAYTETWQIKSDDVAAVRAALTERYGSWHDLTETKNSREKGWTPPVHRALRRTPHQTLFVTNDAPPQVIEAAWKALVRMYHEGSSSGMADSEKLLEINVAYQSIGR